MRFLLALLANLVFVAVALAASPVWEVKKGDNVAYVGGTSHFLRDSDYPLPAAFEHAYAQVQAVVLETDIGALNAPENQKKILAELFYTDGRTLPGAVSPQVWQALVRYGEKAGIPAAALQKMKPAGVALTLLTLELQKIGATRSGVDQFFYEKAKTDGKTVVGLETVEAQIGFLATLGKGMEDVFIEQSLTEMSQAGTVFETTLEAWRHGDEKALSALLIDDTRKNYPEIYRILIIERNRDWLPAIERLLQTPERELILVGAAHLVGPDGIVTALRKRGYQVQQLN